MRETVAKELYETINEFGGCDHASGTTKRWEEDGKSSSLPGFTPKNGLRPRLVSQFEPERVDGQVVEDCVDSVR